MNRLLILLTLTIFSSTLKAQKMKESYHPKEPFEQRIDTVINSNNVTWNFRSAPNSYVIQEYQDGDKLFKYYYRDATFDIVLPTTQLTFDKMSLNEFVHEDYADFENSNSINITEVIEDEDEPLTDEQLEQLSKEHKELFDQHWIKKN